MTGSVEGEIWAWDELSVKNKIANLIPLTVFWVIWKERNSRDFDSVESSILNLKDKWFHYFGFILLDYGIISDVDFGNVIDSLTWL